MGTAHEGVSPAPAHPTASETGAGPSRYIRWLLHPARLVGLGDCRWKGMRHHRGRLSSVGRIPVIHREAAIHQDMPRLAHQALALLLAVSGLEAVDLQAAGDADDAGSVSAVRESPAFWWRKGLHPIPPQTGAPRPMT